MRVIPHDLGCCSEWLGWSFQTQTAHAAVFMLSLQYYERWLSPDLPPVDAGQQPGGFAHCAFQNLKAMPKFSANVWSLCGLSFQPWMPPYYVHPLRSCLSLLVLAEQNIRENHRFDLNEFPETARWGKKLTSTHCGWQAQMRSRWRWTCNCQRALYAFGQPILVCSV